MFDSKKTKLFIVEEKKTSESTVEKNPFIRASILTDVIPSGNLSSKLKTTGSDFVDQFASASKYREARSYKEIAKDMSSLWAQNPLLTLKLTVYFRLITRVCKYPFWNAKTKTVQIGQGLKHESIMRMLWLMINHPDVFLANIVLFISAGSWKDLVTMMQYDAMYNGTDHAFDWDYLIEVIKQGLQNPESSSLVKKYLPTIRNKRKCTTVESQADNIVAKAICSYLFGNKKESNPGSTYAMYRRLKSSGTAHKWQQAISQKRFNELDFNSIAGRALQKLVNSKFLRNHNLEEIYYEWISTKPVAKYTGYVYELFTEVIKNTGSIPPYRVSTINAQFNQLVEQARKDMSETDRGLLCVLDTSGSMSSDALGTKISAYHVAKTMTLFFSELLRGKFYNNYFEFSEKTIHKVFRGPTPVDKFMYDKSRITANTNFHSVATKLVEIRKTGLDESEFPSGILCLSDGEFDSSHHNLTEVQSFRRTLLQGGFTKEFVDNFKIILWDIPNGYYGKPTTKFEALGDTPNTFHIGGLDGSVIQFLLGRKGSSPQLPKTSEELFLAAMDQELLNLLSV